jgi:putative ABC transport system permease protein
MVSGLHRKLLRDVWSARWQFLAISMVQALGVALFHGSLVGYENQKASYHESYDRLAFADVTVAVERAPRSVIRQIARLPGVTAVEGRLVVEVEVEQAGGRRGRVIGRLVTLPPGGTPRVNRVRLLEGAAAGTSRRREALLEVGFARAHGYRPGDRIYPVINGERVAFTVAGIVASPEYIYPVQSKQFLLPTPETFGVLFVPVREVEALLGMAGSINEIVMRTGPGRAAAVGRTVAGRLRAYGPQEPMTQSEQPSNQLLQSDLEGNKPFAIVMPGLFLGAAGLAVSLVLARWVQAQRGQVGFLRASGFPALVVLAHYLQLGMVPGVIGGVLGVSLGHLLGLYISELYALFLHIPYQVREAHPEIGLAALALSLGTAALGALVPARQAAAVPPAEAMRGQMPAPPSLLVRLLPTSALPLRNLLRRPMRTAGTAAGVASAVMLLVISGSFMDSLAEVVRIYLVEIQRHDVSVAFTPPRSQSILHHLRGWPGVLRVEPDLSIPVRVRYGEREKETVALGVSPGSRLRGLPSASGGSLSPLPGTLLFSDSLAERLAAEEGDRLHLTYIQNTRERRAEAFLHAGAPVRQPIGFPVYMRLVDLQRLFAAPLGLPPDAIAGALMEVDPRYTRSIRDRLQRMEGVALVQTKQELAAQIERLVAFNRTFVWMMFLFGAATAFAVIYTSTDSVLWERTRELATLRTIGFDMRRLARLVTVENLLVAGVGAALGLAPGRWLAHGLIQMSQTEGFSLRLAISPRTYLLAFASALLLVFLAQWPGLRRIRRLDLGSAIRLRDE